MVFPDAPGAPSTDMFEWGLGYLAHSFNPNGKKNPQVLTEPIHYRSQHAAESKQILLM